MMFIDMVELKLGYSWASNESVFYVNDGERPVACVQRPSLFDKDKSWVVTLYDENLKGTTVRTYTPVVMIRRHVFGPNHAYKR